MRALKVLVVVMGVMLVGGLIVLVVAIAGRAGFRPAVDAKRGFGQANSLTSHCREKPLRSPSADRTANRHW